ncbi:bactofilin family protein [Spirochaeta dissipatitropha]
MSHDNRMIPKTATRIGKTVRMKGNLSFSESVLIRGSFEGQIESRGLLYIDDGAEIIADVKAENVIVGGMIRGNIEASQRVEMLPSARIYGNVKTSAVRIEDGVSFEGKCQMIKNSDAVDIFSAPVGQLKESVQGFSKS